MGITIKSANPDDIWESWKQKASKSQKLEKHYGVKGAVFRLEQVTATEFVKGVSKAAIIYFEKSFDIKPDKTKPKEEKATIKELERIKFYSFSGERPKIDEWKGKDEVASYQSLKKVSCEKCKGTKGSLCKKCDGTKTRDCPDCDGKNDKLKCKKCDGSGNLPVELEVYDEHNKKTKKVLQVSCGTCLGTGIIPCKTCGGSGKVPCKYCDAIGKSPCSKCDGTGVMYTYLIKPVPFKEEHEAEPIVLSSIKLSGLEKELGKEIQKTLEQVEGILIRNPKKELNQKYVEPNLGYFPKEVGKIVKEAGKEWKNADGKKELSIQLPIYIFPVLALECETKKGKKFTVYGIGSDKKYQVFGEI
jgi:hypothetical protein